MERSIEEVKAFVLERLDMWMSSTDIVEEASEHRALEFIRDRIDGDRMLYKDDAKLLSQYIKKDVKDRVDILQYRMPQYSTESVIMEIDSLDMYSDIWALYCRPGTYRI